MWDIAGRRLGYLVSLKTLPDNHPSPYFVYREPRSEGQSQRFRCILCNVALNELILFQSLTLVLVFHLSSTLTLRHSHRWTSKLRSLDALQCCQTSVHKAEGFHLLVQWSKFSNISHVTAGRIWYNLFLCFGERQATPKKKSFQI